jgi:predicted transcriptional regulator
VTPVRIDLLEALRQCSPCSVHALAITMGRNDSNSHTDVNKLEEHGLVKRASDDLVFVPFESVEIHLALVKKAA